MGFIPIKVWQERWGADRVLQKVRLSSCLLADSLSLAHRSCHYGQYVRPIVEGTIRKKAEEGEPERPCLIYKLSGARDSYTGKEWTQNAIVAECVNSYLAGTDSTTGATSYILWQLAQRPDITRKLQAELDENMSSPDDLIDLQVLSNLSYLNAIINESKLFRSLA